jgi:hypothetical protein
MSGRIRSFGARRIAVVVLAIGLVGVVAVPTILAASTPAAPVPVDPSSLDLATQPARLGRLMRGDVTVLKRDGSTMTVHFERGQIIAASAGAVTLKGLDGTSTTFAIGTATRIRSQGKAATADALKVGDFAMALGTKTASGYEALLIRVPKPAN